MTRNVKNIAAEYVVYLLFWSVLLLSPILGSIIKDVSFFPTYEEMLSFWEFLLPALILFILNNAILMPFLLYRKKGRLFVLYLVCIVVACAIVYISFPLKDPPGIREAEQSAVRQVAVSDSLLLNGGDAFVQKEGPKKLVKREVWGFFVNPRNVQILIAVFVLVFNICVRLFFFSMMRDEHVKELEKEHLRSNLEYLRYQINPHFFMNTLNNIHALIDIDKEKAQKAIHEFSKMMRYVLYDASAVSVPLEKEISFLEGYIDLMRLRYTDKIEIKTSLVPDAHGVYVPPMLFMQFVENAFKHGVTYKKRSLIDISLQFDDKEDFLLFTCRNTVPEKQHSPLPAEQGGVGVENARKRLELLFGDKASLRISNDGEWYNVELKMPIQYDKVYNNR